MSVNKIEIQLTDEQLAGFRAFYLKDYPLLVGMLIKSGTSKSDAEDAAQEAMLSLSRSWPTVDYPKAFVRTVAIRVRDRIWAKARVDRQVPKLRDEITTPFDAREDVGQVLKLIASLPAAQRTVLALTLEGFEPVEIADILGKNPDTVRSNLHHARQKLIRQLDPESIPKEANHGS